MTHSNQKFLTKTLAPFALAVAMIFSGPLIQVAWHIEVPKPQLANQTVIYKQHATLAARVDYTPRKVAIVS